MQQVLQNYPLVLKPSFKTRNLIINEDRLGRDINNFKPKDQLRVLQSYMPMSEIRQQLIHQKEMRAIQAKRFLEQITNSHKSSKLNCGFLFGGSQQTFFGGFNKTGLKAYYKFNEFYLPAANFTENFASCTTNQCDGNWPSTNTTYAYVDTTADTLILTANTSSLNLNITRDLGAGNISDTIWTLRFKCAITSYTASTVGANVSKLVLTLSSNTAIGELPVADQIGMWIRYDTADEKYLAWFNDGGSPNYGFTSTGRTPSAETTYPEVSRISATLMKLILYSDSTFQTPLTVTTQAINSTTNGLRYINWQVFTQSTNGSITASFDDFAFYNSVNPVLRNYAGVVGSADSLGTAADGALNGKISLVSGKIGNAYLYDGSSGHSVLGTSLSQWNFMHNQSALLTAALWYKLTNASTTNEILFDNFNVDPTKIGCRFGLRQDRTCTFSVSNGSAEIVAFQSTNNFIPADTNWHFLVYKYDYSLGSANLTVRLDDSSQETANKSGTASNSNAAHPATVGKRASTNDFYLDASLDEYSIWNRILNASEITALYNSGNGAEIT